MAVAPSSMHSSVAPDSSPPPNANAAVSTSAVSGKPRAPTPRVEPRAHAEERPLVRCTAGHRHAAGGAAAAGAAPPGSHWVARHCPTPPPPPHWDRPSRPPPSHDQPSVSWRRGRPCSRCAATRRVGLAPSVRPPALADVAPTLPLRAFLALLPSSPMPLSAPRTSTPCQTPPPPPPALPPTTSATHSCCRAGTRRHPHRCCH